jgi:hypothetical protein
MMKPKRTARLTVAVALLICLAPLTVFGAEPPENLPNAIGEVVYMVGTVKAEQPDGTVRELDLKKQVIPKDVIVTSTKSSVEIVFKDDSVFSQGSSARISLDEFIYSGEKTASKLLFKMGEGTFRYVTGQIVKQNPDGFALETPTTTIGIRGTEVYATVTPALERVGNLDLSAGHTMSVGPQEISRPMHAVSVDPKTGSVSAPEPVSPDEARAVIKAAPQTTQGEPGVSNEDVDDMSRKAEAFDNNVVQTKEDLSTGKPHYPDLHTLSLQQSAQKNAERDTDKAEAAQASSESGGAGGGGGGHP